MSTEILQRAFLKLIKRSVAQYLILIDERELNLSAEEFDLLLENAAIASLSDHAYDISLSYEICSRLLEIYGDDHPLVIATADLVLSRIGNFPGRTLLREKYLNGAPRVPLPLALERLARESENSIENESLLTDFQYKLYSALEFERSLSVSAPTSAGKSYILNLDLIRRLKRDTDPCIVYLVPTRALVSEVVGRVRSTLKLEKLEKIAVRTAPFPVAASKERNGIVYVLTQERLLRLLSYREDDTKITSLIVDEAHELQKGKRGVLLQNAIDATLKIFPKASVFFASPLIKNPSYLLSVFNRTENGRYFTEEVSPVAQNVLLISSVVKKPRSISIELLSHNGERIPVGTSALTFNFRGGKAEQKSLFTAEICNENESAILFADDAAEAELCANFIAEKTPSRVLSDSISDFISFIKSEIHSEYPLVSCLQKGIAFHYGNMPSIVRNGVERLFKEGEIRFLCSTSTLLQGVNLPAKHIVIQNPHLGREPMSRADFRNLAGRAGRLLKEFHGNVWCLRPGEWDNECYVGENLQEIRGAMDRIMDDGGSIISAVVDGVESKENEELADAAFSRLYYEVVENGEREAFDKYKTEQNQDILRENLAHMAALDIDIPEKILQYHRSLRPDLLQRLLLALRETHHLENLILINPHERGGKERMMAAISIINQAFEIEMPDRYFNWVSAIAHNWVWGMPIGEMLNERVNFIRSRRPEAEASPLIRELLKLIETVVRYRLVKYFAAYEDLLKLAWSERTSGQSLAVAPYHVYLEFGSSDHATLSLMALGLSRFTAIKLKKAINWAEEKEPEDFLRRISQIKIRNLVIPKLCKEELYDLLGET